jgi:hypothetical protein
MSCVTAGHRQAAVTLLTKSLDDDGMIKSDWIDDEAKNVEQSHPD